jgi:hypothetical protein
MDALDPKRLSLPPGTGRAAVANQKPPRHKQGERFLKGPIPWTWLSRAAQAQERGKALHVGNALWFLAGVKRKRTVTLSSRPLRELGVKRHAVYRALRALEKAGLVSVERHPGRQPVVTILEIR